MTLYVRVLHYCVSNMHEFWGIETCQADKLTGVYELSICVKSGASKPSRFNLLTARTTNSCRSMHCCRLTKMY